MSSETFQTGGGQRQTWADLPARTREWVEGRLDARVVAADSQSGGFSPGVAARLTLDTGEAVFIKAVSPVPNPESPTFHRQEALIAGHLPVAAPVPRLRFSLDEGADGWVLLVFDAVEGRMPTLPWDDAELDRVLAAIDRLAETLDPAPVPPGLVGRLATDSVFAGSFWAGLRADKPPALDDWSGRHLDRLVALEREAPAAVDGDALVHGDLRADNVIVTETGVVIVDWPHARVGAPWVDLVALAPSVTMQGGPDPEALMARSAVGRAAPADRVLPAVTAIAGFFTSQALLPPPPGLPTLRRFQADQGAVARAWLGRLAGLG